MLELFHELINQWESAGVVDCFTVAAVIIVVGGVESFARSYSLQERGQVVQGHLQQRFHVTCV